MPAPRGKLDATSLSCPRPPCQLANPDKCLMIVAAADIGPGIASIYREVGGTSSEPFRQVGASTVDRLSELDKDWNARVDSSGDITVGFP